MTNYESVKGAPRTHLEQMLLEVDLRDGAEINPSVLLGVHCVRAQWPELA